MTQKPEDPGMWTFTWRVTSTHTVAYFVAGLLALGLLHYSEEFGQGEMSTMRSTDSIWVAAGPALQIVRGIVLGLVLYPFRSVFLGSRGWLKFWILTFFLSYLLTISPAGGSFEGLVYTSISLPAHFLGLPEVLVYNTLFAAMLWGWHRKPGQALTIVSGALVGMIVLLSTLGMLAAGGMMPQQ